MGVIESQEAEPLVEQEHFVPAADGQRLALAEIRSPDAESLSADAPAFLLVHGLAQNRRGFTLGPMPGALLRRGARVFVGELRGHGGSRVDAGRPAWTLREHLELDCPALLDGVRQRSRVDRVHWVGHSMGGLLGCALLAGDAPLASMTAVAAPVRLGVSRPLVRLASFVGGPFLQLAPQRGRVRMDWFLRALAAPLSAPEATGPVRWFQRLTRLASPAHAEPEALHAILASADAESPAVMTELARNAVLGRARIAGVDLEPAIQASPIPVASVVGTQDIFAPGPAGPPLDGPGHAGPRRSIEIEGATHMDATMGHHVPRTLWRLWRFLTGDSASSARGS